MKTVQYSLICEDIAHQTFLEEFLPEFIKQEGLEEKVSLIFNQEFFYRFRAHNKYEVIKAFPSAAIFAASDKSRRYAIDLLFVGIDFDDKDQTQFQNEKQLLLDKVDPHVKLKTVIFLPVQAIEHWLLYIKSVVENPTSTKNENLESIKRKQAKIQIYGRKNPHKQLTKETVAPLVQQINIKRLINQSQSFNAFYIDLKNAIALS